MNELTKIVGAGLCERLEGFTFVKTRRRLKRLTDEGWVAISINVDRTSSPEIGKLSAYAMIRVDWLENTYNPFNPLVTARDARFRQTVSTNCDKLIGGPLIHGFEKNDAAIEEFIEEYAIALKEKVLPWLNRYSSTEALFDNLIDPNPLNWVTGHRLARFPIVLAVLAKRRDWRQFDQLANECREYFSSGQAVGNKPIAEAIISGLRKSKDEED